GVGIAARPASESRLVVVVLPGIGERHPGAPLFNAQGRAPRGLPAIREGPRKRARNTPGTRGNHRRTGRRTDKESS
ncbi:hypothetical protein, partial [Streptosporangium sp. NPDC003464]